jgi:hypothetical protein
MEGLEPVEERDREARIAVEEVPSIDAMGNCLLVHTAQTEFPDLPQLDLVSYYWFVRLRIRG